MLSPPLDVCSRFIVIAYFCARKGRGHKKKHLSFHAVGRPTALCAALSPSSVPNRRMGRQPPKIGWPRKIQTANGGNNPPPPKKKTRTLFCDLISTWCDKGDMISWLDRLPPAWNLTIHSAVRLARVKPCPQVVVVAVVVLPLHSISHLSLRAVREEKKIFIFFYEGPLASFSYSNEQKFNYQMMTVSYGAGAANEREVGSERVV